MALRNIGVTLLSFVLGAVLDDGKIELYDKNNDYYYYGKLKPDGKLEFL